MNAYLDQLNRMSDSVRSGIGSIARDRLNRATLGLEEAKTNYALSRDEREYNDPTRKLQRQEAQGELDRQSAPVGFTDIAPTPWAQQHFVYRKEPGSGGLTNTAATSTPGAMGNHTASRGGMGAEDERAWPSVPGGQPGQKVEPMLLNKVEGLYGAKLDTRADSQTRGQFVKADGSPLTRREFEGKREQYKRLLWANTDVYKLVRDKKEQAEDEIETISAQLESGKGNRAALTQQLAKARERLQLADQFENDPRKQMEALREQYDMYQAWGDPEAMKGAERVAGQMEKLQARIVDAEKRAYDRANDERNYNLKLAEFGDKQRTGQLAMLKDRITMNLGLLKPYARQGGEADSFAMLMAGGPDAMAAMQPQDQRMVMQVALDVANDQNADPRQRGVAIQLMRDLEAYGSIQPEQQPAPNFDNTHEILQASHSSAQPGQPQGQPPVAGARWSSKHNSWLVQGEDGRWGKIVGGQGQDSQAAAPAVQAEIVQASTRGAMPQPPPQSAQGRGADIAAGEATRARLENNPVARVGRAPAEAAVNALTRYTQMRAAPVGQVGQAISQILSDFQDWAKNRSPTARRLQGRDAVRQYLVENPDKAELLARNGR